jgi:hypothetical protein
MPYFIPRRSYYDFHSDVFPDTHNIHQQGIDKADWLSGSNADAIRIALNPDTQKLFFDTKLDAEKPNIQTNSTVSVTTSQNMSSNNVQKTENKVVQSEPQPSSINSVKENLKQFESRKIESVPTNVTLQLREVSNKQENGNNHHQVLQSTSINTVKEKQTNLIEDEKQETHTVQMRITPKQTSTDENVNIIARERTTQFSNELSSDKFRSNNSGANDRKSKAKSGYYLSFNS